jgi:transketolase N-terminal domain/subunit
MRVDAGKPKDLDRDVLVLSKGHASPALYAALHLRGFLGRDELLAHSTLRSRVYYHPSVKVPGVELATGSLGQGLSFGVGTALAQKRDGRSSRTFVILGDGELDEGSNDGRIPFVHSPLATFVTMRSFEQIRTTASLPVGPGHGLTAAGPYKSIQ